MGHRKHNEMFQSLTEQKTLSLLNKDQITLKKQQKKELKCKLTTDHIRDKLSEKFEKFGMG
jgi:hypothetical protein